jgi:hypothetical protein
VDDSLGEFVRRRAKRRCEYCQLAQDVSSVPFEIDHIIAKQHGGRTSKQNLALACWYCNSSKGPNIAGFDPVTKKLVRLFNPRRHQWSYHFRWDGPYLTGKTAIGRVTQTVLAINDPMAVALRASLIEEGLWEPGGG